MEMHLPLFFSPKLSTTVRFFIGLTRHRLTFRVLAPLAPRKAGDRARNGPDGGGLPFERKFQQHPSEHSRCGRRVG